MNFLPFNLGLKHLNHCKSTDDVEDAQALLDLKESKLMKCWNPYDLQRK